MKGPIAILFFKAVLLSFALPVSLLVFYGVVFSVELFFFDGCSDYVACVQSHFMTWFLNPAMWRVLLGIWLMMFVLILLAVFLIVWPAIKERWFKSR